MGFCRTVLNDDCYCVCLNVEGQNLQSLGKVRHFVAFTALCYVTIAIVGSLLATHPEMFKNISDAKAGICIFSALVGIMSIDTIVIPFLRRACGCPPNKRC